MSGIFKRKNIKAAKLMLIQSDIQNKEIIEL